MGANDLPKSIYLYRDLNGTLVVTENPETIPGDPIGEYYLRITRRFKVE